MKTLLPLAKMLAITNPVDVFKQVMGGIKEYAGVWDELKATYGEESARYNVAAICDLTAMCMMMIAAGVKRIEAMKQGLIDAQVKDSKKSGLLFSDSMDTDQVYLYKSSKESRAFRNVLENWCKLKGNGILQFKFCPNGDWHTFALERAQEGNANPIFFVYQAYQNTYRLLDFLDLGFQRDQRKHMATVWKAAGKYGVSGFKDQEAFTQHNVVRTEQTKKLLGCEKELDLVTIQKSVFDPLEQMLSGEVAGAQYVLMAGSSTLSKQIHTDRMAVLVCNEISPDTFYENYDELLKSKDVTLYPSIDT